MRGMGGMPSDFDAIPEERAAQGRPTDDLPDLPEFLRRRSPPPETCDHCRQLADHQPLQTVADDWRTAGASRLG